MVCESSSSGLRVRDGCERPASGEHASEFASSTRQSKRALYSTNEDAILLEGESPSPFIGTVSLVVCIGLRSDSMIHSSEQLFAKSARVA